MRDDSSNNEGNEEGISNQDNTGNMYSYRDDQTNKKETGAIRRSMGDVNPNKVYPPVEPYQPEEPSVSSGINSNKSEYNTTIWMPYIILALLEGMILLALALLTEYGFNQGKADKEENNPHSNDMIKFNYDELRDINIMAFIGFGLLHSILKRNAWTSISINTLLMAFSVQIALFFNFVWKKAFKEKWEEEDLNFLTITKSIYISCTVVITLGSIIGKLTIIQYLIMALFEIILATMNFQLCQEKLETVDTGGALYVHTFGGVFALSIGVVLFCSTKFRQKAQIYENYNRQTYFSYITTFLGMLFLFIFFPSFNSAICDNLPNMYRARINTYLSLIGSVIGSVVTSGMINEGRLVLEQILYGTISGGIIISGCCSVCFFHWAALILGTLSGAISVIILGFVKPQLIRIDLRDCCNVILIHGVFGILGGFITPMFIRDLETESQIEKYKLFTDIKRSNAKQAGIQIGGLFITLGISFVGGIATGFLMKISACKELDWMYNDAEFFILNNDDQPANKKDDDNGRPSY